MNKTLLMLSALTFSTVAIGLTAYADDAMSGMNMGGAKISPQAKPAPLSVTATVNPAAPQTGDNTLDLMLSDATGKPVTGLKLTTSVAMTSMDMGTTHPAFTETGGGHYTTKVNFGMDGPWRVVVRNQGGKIAVLDFSAGSKTPWKSPQIKTTGVMSTQPAAAAVNVISGMDMSGGKTMDKKAGDKSAIPSGDMAGMDMSGTSATPADQAAGSAPNTSTPGMAGMDMSDTKPMKMTGIADMKTAAIPELKETGTYTAIGDENWKMQTGFGHNAPMVGMMNQMMVGGSGAEGMKMAPMTMKFDKQNYTRPDASDTGDAMPGMDMGGKSKPSDTSKPSDVAGIKIAAETTSAPKAGDNPLTITLTDAQGKPVTGATISASVAMTSMDMGTSHPDVTEKGSGQYAATVHFSMAGPWRVLVKITPPGQKPQTKTFDFTAK